MYKAIKVTGTEPGLNGPGSSHSSMLANAIGKINSVNGIIKHIHTTEIPRYRSFGVGLGYSEVDLTTVIVYEFVPD